MITALRHMAARLRAFFTARALDRDFEQELATHLSMSIEDNLRRGMTPEQARRAALIRMGGTVALTQQHRAVRALPALDDIVQDLRFAFRLIAKDRWLSAAAILVLALGIGANTLGFTIVNAVFFRGLPFEDSDRLYMVTWVNRDGRRSDVAHGELQDWRRQSRAFAGLAGYGDATMNISDDRGLPEQARGTLLTANAFGLLGQQPLLGRDFAPGDDQPGAEPVVMIGYYMWQNRYAADPNVLGRTVRINGQAATIIGVMPERMTFPDNTEVWAPFIPTLAHESRTSRPLAVFGRLRDGANHREAQAELNGIAQQLAAAYPEASKDLVGIRVETFTDAFVGGAARPMFITVMGAAIFVLLIACANVANLLLSRSANRAREIALRMAMGATRWRIVRQLLLESVVLSLLGGTIGLVVALAGVTVFDEVRQASGLPFWIVFTMDYAVFAYVATICVLTGTLFGLAPALHMSKTNHADVLKSGGRSGTRTPRVRRFSTTMVVAELALTMVLLAGAGLMVRSFMTLYAVDLGIRIDNLVTMSVRLPEQKYPDAHARRAFFERLEPRLAATPGVEAAAVTTGVPPSDGGERLLEIDEPALTSDRRPVFVGVVAITPRFFDVLSVPLIRGRNFHDLDGAPGSETVIINERLVDRVFRGEDPLGRRLRFTQRQPVPGVAPDPWRTIVGVSPSIRHGSPQDAYVNSVVYVPYRQESPAAVSLLVRTAVAPASVLDALRGEVQAIDHDQPVYAMQTLEEVLAGDRWWYRTFGSMFLIFAVIALVLSAIGLYAVMAYSVAQRTHEIGVRMAVGAQRRQVSWLILKRGLLQLAIGLTLGLAGALALSRVVRRVLVEITPTDPLTFAAITAMLTVVSLAACVVPARRATRVDPVATLRAE